MEQFLNQFYSAIRANISVREAVFLIGLGLILCFCCKDKRWILTVYTVFQIFYVTIFRRASGRTENIQLYLNLWLNIGVWSGNLLNFVLYIPFGWATQRWKQNRKKTVFASLFLSLFCEAIQFFLKRGVADINDVLFNTLGGIAGAWLAREKHLANDEKFVKY